MAHLLRSFFRLRKVFHALTWKIFPNRKIFHNNRRLNGGRQAHGRVTGGDAAGGAESVTAGGKEA